MVNDDGARFGEAHRARVLVSAASQHGSTAEIARAVGEALEGQGLEVTIAPPGEVDSVDDYDAVVLGSAVYSGHWLRPAVDLVDRCGAALAARRVWLFSSGPVGNPSGKMARGMRRDPVELAQIRATIQPREHRIFAGRLDRASLSPMQRIGLLVVPGLQGDFREWTEIREWARGIAHHLAAERPRA